MIDVREVGECRHPHLMSEAMIGGMRLRNRTVLAAMGTEYVLEDGSLGDRAMDYYEARAAGGAGMIVLETSSVAWPMGMSMPKMLGLSSDDFLPGLTELAERVHAHDCRIAAQLNHSGKVSAHDVVEGRQILVPSIPKAAANDMGNGLTMAEMANFVRSAGPDGKGPRFKEMDQDDIDWVVDCFASAAKRVVNAGFDAVEIHAGHGYMLSSFLSPYANRREDDYGGCLENRARLLLQVVAAIKAELGDDIPILVRIDACEYRTEGGITIDDAVRLSRWLDEAGCHAIDVSAYSNNSAIGFTEGPLVHQPGGYIDFAKAIRAAVTIPVIAVGRIEPDVAEQHIAQGDFDFLAMGRKLLADPELPNKLRDGRQQDIRPCIYCYVCVSQIFINKPLCCAVNPATGEEASLMRFEPAAQPKKVLVVGGGPAGMEAARVLADRGHQVMLWEKEDQLGGTLRVAALAYEPNGKLIDYLKQALEASPAQVALNKTATVADIKALGVDSVVIAVGADRQAPPLPGKDLPHVLDGEELRDMLFAGNAHGKLKRFQRVMLRLMHALKLNRDIDRMRSLSRLYMPLGKRVAIVGGGLVGLEVAELLVERGREVTVLEPGRDFGAELSIVRRWRVLHGLASHGARLLPNAQVSAISSDELSYEQQGEQHRLAVDTVIIAQGAKANTDFEQALRSTGVDVHNIGDSKQIGYIEGAVRSARELAVSL
ncbi:FAD-dependent oxidoreductase [Spongiibacter marinus]|uniref:oxidoreductase n=1 Tax=Spongiibacter marinus TaxID=354246 RepID=UPI0004005840|nr:FAD-dependent oxidoreductase [Spongiibacter marinus]